MKDNLHLQSPTSDDENSSNRVPVELGPGQVQPKTGRTSYAKHGELKLGLLMTKGLLEVEVRNQ